MKVLRSKASQTLFLILLSWLVFGPYFKALTAASYYIPGVDEIYQLQAARELYLGHGYLSARNFIPQDLSNPHYSYVNAWPVGYSFCIAALMKLGLSLSAAAKVFISTSTTLGLGLWMGLAGRFLPNPFHRSLFAVILCTQLPSWMIYSTNCISWALFPLFLLLLLKAADQPIHVLSASLLSSLLILFRYQNLTLIPVGVLWLLWKAHKSMRFRYLPSFAFATLPTLTYGIISYLNKVHTQGTSFLSAYKFSLYWDPKWPIEFLNAFFLGATYRIDTIIFQLGTNYHQEAAAFLLTGALSLTLCCLSAWGLWRLWKAHPQKRDIVTLLLLNLAALAALFWALAIFYNIDNIPIGRYYHFLLPLVFLGLVAVAIPGGDRLEPLGPKKKGVLVLAFLASLILVSNYSKHREELSLEFASKSQAAFKLIDRVTQSDPQAPIFVVTDFLLSSFVVDRSYPTASNMSLLESPVL